MDWVIQAGDRAAVRTVRNQIGEYLRRHGDPDGDVQGAELAVSELLTNVVAHTPGPMWVTLAWPGEHPDLRVIDLGEGFDLDADLPDDPRAAGGRGLFIVGRIVRHLEARRRSLGGSEVVVSLPVSRAVEVSIDPPRRRFDPLPSLDEADPTTGFGAESVLRALVVGLAETVSLHHGPAAAEAAIAQVAADVGGQIEAEFREVTGTTGRLSAEQLGACFTRFERAIDGDFSVVELSDDGIVLQSSRCPFGDAVKRAPMLCRMTSAIFGGIAAGNSDHAAEVSLEERIALGDVGCRVSIRLDPEGATTTWAHRYLRPM